MIVPIWKTDAEQGQILEAAQRIREELTKWGGRGDDRLRVRVDARQDIKPGAKYYEWELRGIPLRLELGPRDLEKQSCVAARRDVREKTAVPLGDLAPRVAALLETIQNDMLAAAQARLEARSIRERITYDKFREVMEGDGAFVYAGWCGDPEVEAKVKEETKATIRVIPDPAFRSPEAPTTCLYSGRPAQTEVVWAKAY